MQVVDYRSKNAAQDFVKSLRETGFGVLKNHPISEDLVSSIYKNWLTFFLNGDKSGLEVTPEAQDGYFSTQNAESAKGHNQKDIKEYYHIYPWGRIPESLHEEIMHYYKVASDLASELLDWVEQYSPPEVAKLYHEPLSSMIKDTPNTLLRVLHYPPLTGNENPDAIRAAAHEDINLLTILPAANEPGLQVKLKSGQWHDIPSDFGNLIINIGDMLQEASGGYFPSTSHRVINPQGIDMSKSRISLPLFLHPRSEVVLSEQHTQHSYLMERLRELGVIE
ncbi:2OG-Fe(II) oxygenase family protein [Thalassotalea aquiviva]|uniref:2OG-Fe(II) oxygenase family protein n=1 Tax=Thalassotalea aquiviva TaxID=3242415 RepID=UPI00352BA53E